MAHIEIWTRDVSGTSKLGDKAPQHTFFIKVNDDNTREIIRGGPDNDSMATGELGIIKQSYNGAIQSNDTETYDWYDPSSGSNPLNYQGTSVYSGSQAEIDSKWNIAWNEAQHINSQQYDYESLGQNCNAVTHAIANVLGVKSVVNDFLQNAADVWTPGWGNEFEDGWLDNTYDWLFNDNNGAGTAGLGIDFTAGEFNNWLDNFSNNYLDFSFENDYSDYSNFYDLDVYSNSDFDRAWDSFGFSEEDLFDFDTSGWSSFGSENSYLDDFTFDFGGSDFTFFGSGDFITLPTFSGFTETSGGISLFNVNPLFDDTFSRYLEANNRVSPLILDLNNNGIETTGLYDTKVFFDIDADGFAEKVGWVKPTEGLLAIDTNNNGIIDDITELFGDDKMPAFDKLRQFDSNHDGKINASDADYNKLLVWKDLSQDGRTNSGELQTLQQAGVKEISLSETVTDIYQNDNYISSKASFTKFDNSTAEIADVHFMNDNINTWFMGAQSQVYGTTYQVDPETLLLPLSRGSGSLA